ncbi:MAG: M36 family metallopeptidase [Saprospiraceae bacterium]|nr:M36 family metallopeptidase [Saprospiraceae bacterium]
MNNVMHDFAYHYGFTEQAGISKLNFSERVKTTMRSLPWLNLALMEAGCVTMQISFLRRDGTNGRMRMFVWNQTGTKL